MKGAEVAEVPFTPKDWKHEELRLIVRRMPVTAAELLAGSPKARRRKTIPPEQLQMVLDGQLDSTYAYSFIVTDIPASEESYFTASARKSRSGSRTQSSAKRSGIFPPAT